MTCNLPVRLLFALLLMTLAAGANDNLADRKVIWASDLETSAIQDSTYGAGVEPGEINLNGLPADSRDRSRWYEWTASRDAFFWVTAHFSILSYSPQGPFYFGFAAYSLKDGATEVRMENLEPAGGGERATRQGRTGDGASIKLNVRKGQKIVLRAWTRDEGADIITSGKAVRLSYLRSLPLSTPGDSIGTAIVVPRYPERQNVSERLPFDLTRQSRISAQDCRIGDRYLPACHVEWYKYKVPATGTYCFSAVRGSVDAEPEVGLLAIRQGAGGLSLLDGPAGVVRFQAVAGEDILIRAGSRMGYGISSTLVGGPLQSGDEPEVAARIVPGTTLDLTPAGSSPTTLTPQAEADYPAPAYADVWYRYRADETGVMRIESLHSMVKVSVFEDGINQRPARAVPFAGHSSAASAAGPFWIKVEKGKGYLFRILWTLPVSGAHRISLGALQPLSAANDEVGGAQLLVAEDSPILRRDTLQGASISAEEGVGTTLYGRALWYSVDWPGQTEPWRFSVIGSEVSLAGFHQTDGKLTALSSLSFIPAEGRTFLRVRGGADERFMLLGQPDVAAASGFSAAREVVGGQEYWFNAAPGYNWFFWDADRSGLVHLAASGTGMEVFTGTSELELQTVRYATANGITGFHANSGTRYWIRIPVTGSEPLRFLLQPGGWVSAYDAWLQRFPAWYGIPEFMDPHGDADRDGVSNLLDMALSTSGGLTVPSSVVLPFPVVSGQRVTLSWTANAQALAGAPGGRPLQLYAETSPDMVSWKREEGISVRLDSPEGKRFARLRVSP